MGSIVKSKVIPPPIGGLNLIDPPHLLADDEALQLDNYWIFDWGVRERDEASSLASAGITPVNQIIPLNTSALLLMTDGVKVRKGSTGAAYAASDCTGTPAWCQFKQYVFVCGGTHLNRYDIAGDAVTLDPFTGPTLLSQMWSYKGRLYGIDSNTQDTWYAGSPGDIAGAMTKFSLNTILNTAKPLLFGAALTANQGLSNDELWMVCTTDGEILLYQGDWPGGSTWGLIGRTKIPSPVNAYAMAKVGSDLVIMTTRGLISMQQVIAGAEQASYYNLSRKLGAVSTSYNTLSVGTEADAPFLYLSAGNKIYVLNYERGAWSRFYPLYGGEGFNNSSTMRCCAAYGNTLLYNADGGGGGGGVYQIDISSSSSSPAIPRDFYIWKSKYFDLGSSQAKKINRIRTFARYVGTASSTTYASRIGISKDFDTTTYTTDAGLVAAVPNGSTPSFIVETTPASPMGRYLSLQHRTNTGDSRGATVEIIGAEILFEEGGQP